MSQADYSLANQPGAAFRLELNNNLAAILSNNSGPSAPAATAVGSYWFDTTNREMKQRNAGNNDWITLYKQESTSQLVFYKDYTSPDISASPVTDLALVKAKTVTVTGNGGPIESFGVTPDGYIFNLIFSGTPTIRQAANKLILPGGQDIVAGIGDVLTLKSLGGGKYRAINYMDASTPPGSSGIPRHAIMFWPLGIAAIPSGWALCDGKEGRPNTAGKFPRGATAGNVGETGGSTDTAAHVLTVDEIPSHNHLSPLGYPGSPAVNAVPSFSFNNGPAIPSHYTGGGQSHTHQNSLPPFINLAMIIKL